MFVLDVNNNFFYIDFLYEGKHDNTKDQLVDIFPIKVDPSSFKLHYQNLTMKLSGLQSNFDIQVTGSSDELSDTKEANLEETTLTTHERIEVLNFSDKELFYYILSSFLALAHTNILSKDSSIYMSYIERCLQYMIRSYQEDNQLTLLYSHYYGLTQIITALLIVMSMTKDGVAELNNSNLFQNFYDVSLSLMKEIQHGVNVFLLLNLLRSVISSIVYSLNTVCDVDVEIPILTKFIKLGYFVILKKSIVLFDNDISSNDEDNITQYNDRIPACTCTKHSFAMIELITKHLVKICKHLKGNKGKCFQSSNKQVKLGKRRKSAYSKRTERTKHLQQFVSSDDEIFQEGDKSSSESECGKTKEGNSTENVSDFNIGSSDTEKAERETKLKPDTHACKKDTCKRGKLILFESFLSIFTKAFFQYLVCHGFFLILISQKK